MAGGLPAPKGASMAGDDYQHLFTLMQALKLMRKSDCVERIEMEAREAGNVDDVVVHRRGRPSLYHQVKFVVDHRDPLSHEWFTTVPRGSKKSPLQRFYESYWKLSTEEHSAELGLITNRPVDPGDPVLQRVSGRDATLGQRLAAAAATSAAGTVRAEWAAHVAVSEGELLEMLRHLRVEAGQDDYKRMRETCGWLMESVALRGDEDAVERGRDEIRRIIIEEECRELDLAGLEEIVERLGLHAREPRAALLIQAIDSTPWPDAASASVDWVDLYEGDEPRTRRRLRDPSLWNERLRPELQRAAAEALKESSDVLLLGAMRLSAGFAAGVELSDVAKVRLSITARDEEWSTDEAAEVALAEPRLEDLGLGDELVIGISVTGDLHEDVADYLRAEGASVGRLITLSPANGVGHHAVGSGAEALGLAKAIRDHVRGLTKGYTCTLHLFMFAPLGLAVFLGHLWNRVPATQLYEELGSTGGYQKTFLIPA